ncbi:hypothetical protein [Thioalkalivibrio sp. HK1]|uniref:hypothetical protein n=1 Tax=Thioalkalivibrio sp. HK1 TaxID=1469245 RepID=UPI0004BB1F91|nr:hypothetical protein [Thioalkalivibrio sp. HK1]
MSLKINFPSASGKEGFRSSALADKADADPDIILRELTQNALDAARDAKREVTQIRIEIESLSLKDIPALESYISHFESACRFHDENGSLKQAEGIVKAIRSSIESDTELRVMWFLDNGIGLDKKRMERLLGDGDGSKKEDSAGSFGVGHLVSFPASNIRYVLYGGISDADTDTEKNKASKKSRIFSGQAILAAHQYPINESYRASEKSGGGGVRSKSCSKDGYLVKSIADDLLDPYEFYRKEKCPDILLEKFETIENIFETGSVVGILAFNSFRRFDNDDENIENIERAIASHFLPLVFKEKLKVEIYLDGECCSKIDSSRLQDILGRYRNKTRSRKNSVGPSGSNIWDAYCTLKNPHPKYQVISTSFGEVSLYFRFLKDLDERSGTRIHLYRNGMWIEKDLPRLSRSLSEFNRSDPFNALLLLDPDVCRDACDIVRKAEGPRHTSIDITALDDSADRQRLASLFDQIKQELLKIAPSRQDSETAFFSDFFVLSGSESNLKNSKPKRADQQSSPGPGNRSGKGADKKRAIRSDSPWKFKRQGNRLETKSLLVTREGGYQIRLKAMEKVRNAELRLSLVSGTDASCDQPIPDEFIEIEPSASLAGKPILDKDYKKDDSGKIRTIVLGKLDPEEGEIDIWVPCNHPNDSRVEVQVIRRGENNHAKND